MAESEFIEAVKAGDVDRVRSMLEADPGLRSAQTASGESAVLLATYYGREAVACVLVGAGAPLDLFEAAATGTTARLLEILEFAPGRVHEYSRDGWTPLHLAAFFDRAETVRLLLDLGADMEARSKNDEANMPLHAATAGQREEVVGLLLAHGADVNARTGQGWTPLHLAAHGGDEDLVRTFLSHGAQPAARSGDGQTPLDLARQQGQSSVIDLLKEHGADS